MRIPSVFKLFSTRRLTFPSAINRVNRLLLRTRVQTVASQVEANSQFSRALWYTKSRARAQKNLPRAPKSFQEPAKSTLRDLPSLNAEICTTSQGIRIRPSNYIVFYSTSKNESCWRRGGNADFAITWGDVSGHLLFFVGSRSDPENLIFHF